MYVYLKGPDQLLAAFLFFSQINQAYVKLGIFVINRIYVLIE